MKSRTSSSHRFRKRRRRIRKPPVIFYGVLLLLPAILIAGVAARLLSHEQERLARAHEEAARGTLQAIRDSVDYSVRSACDQVAGLLIALRNADYPAGLSALEERHPLVRNAFVWEPGDGLVLPDPALPMTREQKGFATRYGTLFEGMRQWPGSGDDDAAEPSSLKRSYRRASPPSPAWKSGWIPWFWEDRLYMLGWVEMGDDGRFGAELEMAALLADLLSGLPKEMPDGQILTLVDGGGREMYRTGDIGKGGFESALRIPIGEMLPHWELVLYTPDGTFRRAGTGFAVLTAVLVSILFVVLFASGGLLLREAHRNRIDAEQKTSFVSNVSHELKTPLTTIRMYADLLAEGRVSDPVKKRRYLSTIVGESERLTRLVNNVLDFSRLEQHRKKYQISAFDLCELLEETLQSQRIRLTEAGMDLELGHPGEAVMVETDRDAIQQVVLNVVDNAIKYAASGKRLSVRLSSGTGCHRIAIADAGGGIGEPHRRRIFERFYRIDSSITANHQGCGLGLAIAHRLLVDLGGGLEYEPAEGGGACFVLKLPLKGDAA
ncbi:Alkaline phosphatase synthesis sensor protein PhoR [Pontiella desulfatans]|uniref:histidine kinase n=1 Tax=Pontiella desulfatans TaxID=2750659 RepID=A0A6C2U3D6_PONDE|nr:HAMP domain-containing sensor histidine kinase [Pontiella desulfatans]VGO14309.1 Alkaline phosphatase synthesis sensor protein PhoR [Pontiella desulfatans]